MTSYRDWVVETSSTTGTGTYSLSGSPPAGTSYFTFRQRFSNGETKVVYWVVSADRTKWEKNQFGTLTYGTPDTLSRNVIESTNGDSAVSWVGGDAPLRIYVVPDAAAQEFAISMGLATTRPSVLKYGLWADEDGVSAGVDLLNLYDGTSDIAIGDIDTAAHSFILKPGLSGWRQLGVASPAAASTADFTGIPSTINHIMASFELVMGTTAVGLFLRTFDAGGTIDAGASDYVFSRHGVDTAAASGGLASGGASAMSLTGGNNIHNNSTIGISGFLTAENIQAARLTKFSWRAFWLDSGGSVYVSAYGGGARQEADRITGIRFLPSSGTFSGKITLFGAI